MFRGILWSIALLAFAANDTQGQVQRIQMRVPTAPTVQLELRELFRIGSLDGPHDAFGRITSAAFDSRGRIVVADDLNARIALFDSDGTFIADIGQRGRGPGEFLQPWLVAVGPADSVFVWDAGLASIQVFDPALRHGRSFRVPSHWIISGMVFLDSDRIVVAAFGRGESHGLHVLGARDGAHIESFGPSIFPPQDLGGFEGSLLGGSVAGTTRGVVYTTRTPYSIYFLDDAGIAQHVCTGDRSWTTEPQQVVVHAAEGTGLQWDRFVHSARILSLGGGRYLNVIVDPTADRRILDVLDGSCRLLARRIIDVPITPIDQWNSRILAVQNLDFAELVVFAVQLRR